MIYKTENKMKKIRIVADSTCDLSPELIEKYDVSIIPLCIIMNEKSYFDGVEVTPADIYKWADENKTTPKTAAVTFDYVADTLKPFIDAGDDIIFFGISMKMSSTCNVVRVVGENFEYGRIFVIDSQNLSTGIGLQVIRAAELAANGADAESIVSEIEKSRGLVRASFVVDNLTYLARGGRCTAATAMMANVLGLHPMISVRDGAMGVSKKYRGKMLPVLKNYVSDLKADLLAADSSRVFLTHSGCDKTTIDAIYAELEALNYFDEILVTQAGGVISSHCGPNALGVLFYEKEY
jgi:DegV family protein with EDD domain